MKIRFLIILALSATILLSSTEIFGESKDKPHFIFFRTGTSSSISSIYVYGFDKFSLLAGGVIDPFSDYREYDIGLGLNPLGGNKIGFYPYVAAGRATDGWYLELWAFPYFHSNKISATAFIGLFQPLQKTGIYQLIIDPATVHYKLSDKLAIGASYTLAKLESCQSEQSVGPSIQLSFKAGSLTFDLLKDLRDYKDEMRVTFEIFF